MSRDDCSLQKVMIMIEWLINIFWAPLVFLQFFVMAIFWTTMIGITVVSFKYAYNEFMQPYLEDYFTARSKRRRVDDDDIDWESGI